MPKAMKPAKQLPKNEILWLTQLTESGEKFFITSDKIRSVYTLWQLTKEGYLKVGTGNTPAKLEEKIQKMKG